MSKKLGISFTAIFILIVLISSCVSTASSMQRTSVISKTSTGAYIKGVGPTKIEAKIAANEKAKKVFENFEIIGEPEYSQEVISDKYSGKTYWICVIEIKKVE